jgi:hypothetical protein
MLLLCVGCSGGSARALHVRLNAGPAAGPFDTPVHITASGLPPGGLVTLAARTRGSDGRPWASSAQFRASAAGTLNLASAVPVSGSYHVADAAGLQWSLHPAFASGPDTQFDIGKPGFTVRLQVLVGGRVQAAATLVRLWSFATGPTVQTLDRDGFASTLFTPDKVRPGAPAVVVIGGSGGGEDTFTAGALALLGYPALALGYFQEPGLPTCLCDIPLEYFAGLRDIGHRDRAGTAQLCRPRALHQLVLPRCRPRRYRGSPLLSLLRLRLPWCHRWRQ